MLTLGLWGKLGRLTHYAFDAVLSKLSPQKKRYGKVEEVVTDLFACASFHGAGGYEAIYRVDVSVPDIVFSREKEDVGWKPNVHGRTEWSERLRIAWLRGCSTHRLIWVVDRF